ncbi:peptidoglycan-binding protein [Actinotalea ferrariae]|uniref:phage tail protein n=1 Tax=Actinotalea ferrariae TaxID=1386098 RepID=UPI001C8B8C3B|nr:phage tail protein [Actinotalea ferrariae]MBX9247139.1 peptidoglycan-binding protein [Actinotalea ferrariae]
MFQHATLHTETHQEIPFEFNPAELTITKGATWQASTARGTNAPTLRFEGGQSGTLSMSITIDATASGTSVTDETDKLLGLVRIDRSVRGDDRQRQSGRPPWVELHWGRLHAPFRAVVERLQIRYTYFSATGVPLRAKVDLTLKQYDDETVRPRQNPTSYTPSPHTVHHLLPGESLDRVAARYYGDPTRWRLIATASGVDDPLAVAAGTPLVIPEVPVSHRVG